MHYTLEQSLPKVYIEKDVKGKQYNLHWDAQDIVADCVLDEERSYIEGFVDGCVQILRDTGHNLPDCSYGHRTGYVSGLTKQTAELLCVPVENLLHTLVKARYEKLEKETKGYLSSE